MTGIGRRRLLGAAGGGTLASIAGCLDLLESDDPPRRFDADELDPILETDTPDVVRPAPVQPSEDAVETSLERLDELIDDVPDPLETDDVPNEEVRDRIDGWREMAEGRRTTLEDDSSPFHVYRANVPAKRDAGQASGAFAVIEGERTRSGAEGDRETMLTDLEARREAIEYVGDDPERTLVLAHRLEDELATAERFLENRPRDRYGNDALATGEIVGALERARGAIGFVEELEDRHVDRLEDERSFATTFESAVDVSLEAVDTADIPDRLAESQNEWVDVDVADTVAQQVLTEAGGALFRSKDQLTETAEEGEVATPLWYACAFERDVRAYEALVEAIEGGAHREIETIEDVRELRESALEAAADSPFDPAEPSLGGDFLADAYERLETADRRVRDSEDGRSYDLLGEYARYALTGAQLEALPDAVSAVQDRL